jgi:hypothetical protein
VTGGKRAVADLTAPLLRDLKIFYAHYPGKLKQVEEWSQIERTEVDKWQERHSPQRAKAWLVFSRNSD